MNAFEEDQSKLSGLHFAQESMRKHERVTLHLAEAMQRRCQAVLDLHAPAEKDGHTWCTFCTVQHGGWIGYPCKTVQAIFTPAA